METEKILRDAQNEAADLRCNLGDLIAQADKIIMLVQFAAMRENEALTAKVEYLQRDNTERYTRIKKLEGALDGLYQHTKNNKQICGLNEIAKAAMKEARDDKT
jgi:hypothetical protein